ncbi:heavy metal-binding domain-containing protein [Rufibacter sediminis]|uniref:Heavy metal binding domain-containing protein n=1 Tax=Rufibacter sediminis TaxID=2762756 RepID=A0ABR6VRN6_9BACT|nr:heavy metal-binding domain-containing protein [Rufibacter sediminis]MBC3539834.1 hypothetical protein [Rufibacter sediminis]
MKSLKANFVVAFFGMAFFSACNSSGSDPKTTEQTETQTQAGQPVAGVSYTCPMHPEVVSAEKGKCPKCGMFLEEVKPGQTLDSAAAAQEHQHQEGDQH